MLKAGPGRPSISRDSMSSAVDKLLAFGDTAAGRGFTREAILRCLDADQPPGEWEESAITGIVAFGHRRPDGRRLVDLFLEARGRELSLGECAAILALQQTKASLFEVESVRKGAGLRLKDLTSEGSTDVREFSASAQLSRGDVIFAWLVDMGDRAELAGPSFFVPPLHLRRVVKAFQAGLDAALRRHPDVPMGLLGGDAAPDALRALRKAVRTSPGPALENTDAEKLLLCQARYDVSDEAAVRERLAALPGMEPEGGAGIDWIDPVGNDRIGGPLLLGHLEIRDGKLSLETNSRERLDRGKRLLESALGPLAVHRLDSVEDPTRLLREAREPRSGHEPIPEAQQREVLGPYLVEYYRKWLDLPLPALSGKSPREAARTAAGRRKVEGLFTELERGIGRQPGLEAVDFLALRREIGLPTPPSQEPSSYDASRPPGAGWLERDEGERIASVRAFHERVAVHPPTPDPYLHATAHVVVENQIAGGAPAAVGACVARLIAEGATRHEALHAVAEVMTVELAEVVSERRVFDEERVARKLRAIDARKWKGSAV